MGFIYIPKQHYTLDTCTTTKCNNFDLIQYLLFDPSKLTGWNTDFIISGDCIHHILINYTPSIKTIDFCIFTEKGFYTLLNFFNNNMKISQFNVFNWGVELKIKNNQNYIINLYNTLEPKWNLISAVTSYELDFNRCFYDGSNIIMFPDCKKSIDTNVISNLRMITKDTLLYTDIKKSIDMGYKFEDLFYYNKKLVSLIDVESDIIETIRPLITFYHIENIKNILPLIFQKPYLQPLDDCMYINNNDYYFDDLLNFEDILNYLSYEL
jgi:hypothetical protein